MLSMVVVLVILGVGYAPSLVRAQFGPLPVNCPVHPTAVPLPTPLPTTLTNMLLDLEAYIEELMDRHGLSGTSAAIVYDQEIVWSQGFGWKNKNKESAGPVTPDTMFRVGSITKVFTVLLLLKLRDEGLLSLDDPVSKYWPNFNVTSPYSAWNQGITFRELATQLSGLFAGTPCNYVLEGCNITTAEAFDLISQEEVIFPSDYYPHYSDLAFAIIGRAVEPLMNMTWEEAMQKFFYSPLNMTNTGNVFTSQIESEIAQSFLNGTSLPLFIGLLDLGWARPTGQTYSTANDLANFLKMFFRDSDPGFPENDPIVWRSSLREMLLPVWVNDDLYSGFSMPWENFYANQSQTWFHTKGGLIPGYTTFIGLHPIMKVGFVVQQNDVLASYIGQEKMDEILYAFQQAFAELDQGPPNPGNLTSFVGIYRVRLDLIPFTYNITLNPQGNGLIANSLFGTNTLTWMQNNVFQIGPVGPTPCINIQIGNIGELMFFQTDPNNNVISLTTPGEDGFYGSSFKKIS